MSDHGSPSSPPHNLEAERAVLGACLTGHASLVADTQALVGEEHFYHPRHVKIWRLISALAREGLPVDAITVADRGRSNGVPWNEPDDSLYLAELFKDAPTLPGQVAFHAEIVRKHAAARELRVVGVRIQQAAESVDLDRLTDTLEWARQELAAAAPATAVLDAWQPMDLGPILQGGSTVIPPTILIREDGKALLYPGRVHSIAGEPESGKSWVALLAAAQEIEQFHVLYVDFEDNPDAITGRLMAIGARPEHIASRFHYIRPDRPLDTAGRAVLKDLIANQLVTLVVLDGITEAMTLHGLDPEKTPDSAKFYELLPRFITRCVPAPAVLMIDHVPKSKDREKRYAFGAQHKLAGLDGVAYMCDIRKSFAPGVPGYSVLRIAKDRLGGVRQHAARGVAAEIHIDGNAEQTVVTVRLDLPAASSHPAPSDSFYPTALMERVSRHVEINPGASKNVVEQTTRGKAQYIRLAIDLLMEQGYMRSEPGEQRAVKLYSERPYRERELDESDNEERDRWTD